MRKEKPGFFIGVAFERLPKVQKMSLHPYTYRQHGMGSMAQHKEHVNWGGKVCVGVGRRFRREEIGKEFYHHIHVLNSQTINK